MHIGLPGYAKPFQLQSFAGRLITKQIHRINGIMGKTRIQWWKIYWNIGKLCCEVQTRQHDSIFTIFTYSRRRLWIREQLGKAFEMIVSVQSSLPLDRCSKCSSVHFHSAVVCIAESPDWWPMENRCGCKHLAWLVHTHAAQWRPSAYRILRTFHVAVFVCALKFIISRAIPESAAYSLRPIRSEIKLQQARKYQLKNIDVAPNSAADGLPHGHRFHGPDMYPPVHNMHDECIQLISLPKYDVCFERWHLCCHDKTALNRCCQLLQSSGFCLSCPLWFRRSCVFKRISPFFVARRCSPSPVVFLLPI